MTATIIGVGNLLVADDGVGIRVVQMLQGILADDRVQCVESERGGLDVLEYLEGTERGIVIDAAMTGRRPPGNVTRFLLRRPFVPGRYPSLHALSIDAVLSLGESAAMDLPEEVALYAIEAVDIEHFGRGCTSPIAAAIPLVVSMVLEDLRSYLPDIAFSREHEHPECTAHPEQPNRSLQ
jgi:hydrogenase maturation protease